MKNALIIAGIFWVVSSQLKALQTEITIITVADDAALSAKTLISLLRVSSL